MRTFMDVHEGFLYQQTVFFCHLFVVLFSVDMENNNRYKYDFGIVR
jgi:hypothetical protein